MSDHHDSDGWEAQRARILRHSSLMDSMRRASSAVEFAAAKRELNKDMEAEIIRRAELPI